MTCGLTRLILEDPGPPGEGGEAVVYDVPKSEVPYFIAQLKTRGWELWQITIIDL